MLKPCSRAKPISVMPAASAVSIARLDGADTAQISSEFARMLMEHLGQPMRT